MEYKTLNNGLKMPMVGLGVYNIPERDTQRVVEDAVSVGYRSIDTAAMYYNEKAVGNAVRACGVPREELFITTKICDSCYSREDTLRSVDHSMKLLGMEYVDLMLIHWPVGNPSVMWHTLEELYIKLLSQHVPQDCERCQIHACCEPVRDSCTLSAAEDDGIP